MMKRITALLSFVGVLALLPALTFAQATGSNFVSVTSSPASTSTYTPGAQNATLGTITLTGTQQGSVELSSLPLMLSTTGGGLSSDLTNCQLVSSTGTALNTGANIPTSISSTGTNTLTFDTPLTLSYNSPVTLTISCNIAQGAVTGAGYTFTAQEPTLPSSLGVSLTTFPTVAPGEVSAPIAAITLNPSASGSAVSISSIPISMSFGGNLAPSDVSNCRIRSSGTSLTNNFSGMVVGGTNTLMLDTPLTLSSGAAAIPLILTCDISSASPLGSTIMTSITPSTIPAIAAGTNETVTPEASVNATNGTQGQLSGTTEIATATTASANTGGSVSSTGTTGFVGGPNTGGTNPLIGILLAAAVILGATGGALALRKV